MVAQIVTATTTAPPGLYVGPITAPYGTGIGYLLERIAVKPISRLMGNAIRMPIVQAGVTSTVIRRFVVPVVRLSQKVCVGEGFFWGPTGCACLIRL